MLIVMAVTLYTSRVILAVLGVEDFGIYNVIAGLATSFVFFSSSLSNSTQRYLNFELGKGNYNRVRDIFNLSFLIYIIIAIIIFLLIEILGAWFLVNKLTIPVERIYAAQWVLHTFSISLCVTLIGTAFDSVLIAHENMKIYAYVGLVDALAKLLIVYLLNLFSWDKLILFSLLSLMVTVISRTLPAVYCFRKYDECKLHLVWNFQLFQEMFRFIGWNLFGCAVYAINEQGISILLNIFFGPVINAAKAIANQVNSAVNNFSNNFFVSVRPQIVKLYASKALDKCIELVFVSSRYGFYLMWMICLPLILRRDYILELWLGNVPQYTSKFVLWILIYSLINVLTNPVWNLIQAIGEMKLYMLIGSGVYLLAFPIGYIFLVLDFNPVVVFQVLAVVRLIYVFVTTAIVNKYVEISIKKYICDIIIPILLVVVTSSFFVYLLNSFFKYDFSSLVAFCIISIICIAICIYICGIKDNERELLRDKINKIINAG